jgi:hypothetical protein
MLTNLEDSSSNAYLLLDTREESIGKIMHNSITYVDVLPECSLVGSSFKAYFIVGELRHIC